MSKAKVMYTLSLVFMLILAVVPIRASGVDVALGVEIIEVLVPPRARFSEEQYLGLLSVIGFLGLDLSGYSYASGRWLAPDADAVEYVIVVGITERGCREIFYQPYELWAALPKVGHRYDVYFTQRPLAGVCDKKAFEELALRRAKVVMSYSPLTSGLEQPLAPQDQLWCGLQGPCESAVDPSGKIKIRNAEVIAVDRVSGLSGWMAFYHIIRVRTEAGCELELYLPSLVSTVEPQVGHRYDILARQNEWFMEAAGAYMAGAPYALTVAETLPDMVFVGVGDP